MANGGREGRIAQDDGQPPDDEGHLANRLAELGDRDRGHERCAVRPALQEPHSHEFAAQGRRGGDVIDGVAGDPGRQQGGQRDRRSRPGEGHQPTERVGQMREDLLQNDRSDPPAHQPQVANDGGGPERVQEKPPQQEPPHQERPLDDPQHPLGWHAPAAGAHPPSGHR